MRRATITTVGARFGLLTITRAIDQNKVEVRCACGTVKEAWRPNLVNGTTTSCGCAKGTHRSFLDPRRCLLQETWK